MDLLESEFPCYQVQQLPALSPRVDEAWCQIENIRSPGCDSWIFPNLAKVMKNILVIFHSNSDCEHVFSLVNKNMKTPMLSALITRKAFMLLRGSICYREAFSDQVLRKAKTATYLANHMNHYGSS